MYSLQPKAEKPMNRKNDKEWFGKERKKKLPRCNTLPPPKRTKDHFYSHKNTQKPKAAAAAADEMLYTQRNEKKDPSLKRTQNRG